MSLFTPVRHVALHCDAYLIDTSRSVRPLRVELATPAGLAIEALLDRVLLMGRSLSEVRDQTFALFGRVESGELTVAPTAPFHDGVLGALRDTLAEFGAVTTGADTTAEASGLPALLAYERGRVSFFDAAPTRAWLTHAGNRALRILAPAYSHDPDPDLEIEIGETT